MKRYIKASTKDVLPKFGPDWENYHNEEDMKFYIYHDEKSGLDYELVKTDRGWNGNVDGEPLITDPRRSLYKSADAAIKGLQVLADDLY